MSRTARVAFLVLVAASFGAFFVAQKLKVEKPAIGKFKRDRHFSPNGDGRKDTASLRFRVKEGDDVTIDVVDEKGARVRRVVTGIATGAGDPVRAEWDGRTDAGTVAPDGLYRVRIGLRRQGRSVAPRLGIFLDTRAPSPAVIGAEPQTAAPGQPVRVRIRGVGPRAVPRFRVLDTTADPPRTVAEFDGRRDDRDAVWDGRTTRGAAARPGTYLIAVGSRDRAGNFGWGPPLPPQAGTVEGRPGVTVRALAVQSPVEAVRAGDPVTFRVDARRRPWSWQIRRIGESRARKRSRRRKTSTALTVEAPRGVSGVYLLEVRSGRHRTAVPFAVQSRERSPLLVVLPGVSWLGTAALDDPRRPDGIPNTLRTGQPVPYPRTLHGLPDGFADEVAPLLVALDRARVRYDLTTDLELALSDGPRTRDRPGLLFAGTSRWVNRPLARRLRRYVAEGGRVAVMGPGSLRAGVQISGARLTQPTAPGPADAFGQRLADLRRRAPAPGASEPAPLIALTDDPPQLPVFTAFDGQLDHPFAEVEELISPERGELVAGIGDPVTEAEIAAAEAAGRPVREQRSAFTVVRLGEGYVIRIGLTGWVPRLEAGDAEVAQLTRNVVDLLRRVNPRPRSVGR